MRPNVSSLLCCLAACFALHFCYKCYCSRQMPCKSKCTGPCRWQALASLLDQLHTESTRTAHHPGGNLAYPICLSMALQGVADTAVLMLPCVWLTWLGWLCMWLLMTNSARRSSSTGSTMSFTTHRMSNLRQAGRAEASRWLRGWCCARGQVFTGSEQALGCFKRPEQHSSRCCTNVGQQLLICNSQVHMPWSATAHLRSRRIQLALRQSRSRGGSSLHTLRGWGQSAPHSLQRCARSHSAHPQGWRLP